MNDVDKTSTDLGISNQVSEPVHGLDPSEPLRPVALCGQPNPFVFVLGGSVTCPMCRLVLERVTP